jgi:hypothetical protein
VIEAGDIEQAAAPLPQVPAAPDDPAKSAPVLAQHAEPTADRLDP